MADGTVEGTPGEAVLTNGDVTGVVAEAKVTREQVRAKNKETLLEIIDNTNLSDDTETRCNQPDDCDDGTCGKRGCG